MHGTISLLVAQLQNPFGSLLHAKHATQYNKFSGVSTNHKHYFIGTVGICPNIFFVYRDFSDMSNIHCIANNVQI